jgi:hypothetical protein
VRGRGDQDAGKRQAVSNKTPDPENGLIYLDSFFILDIVFYLKYNEKIDFAKLEVTKMQEWQKHINYSEQGMQGCDYVSMDVSEAMILLLLEAFQHI